MKKLLLLIVVCALAYGASAQNIIRTPVPERAKGQTDMVGFAADPIPVVRVGFIGLGMRGPGAVNRFTNIEGIEIVAICDMEQQNLDRVQQIIEGAGRPKAKEYIGDENAWKKLVERKDIDLIYIATDWVKHTPMAVYSMEQGKHVVSEVPAAMTMDECWALVDTAERTRRHFMMLENCAYDRFEMATLNMAQHGVFGDLVHVEGAYIHDLRQLSFNDRFSETESYQPGAGHEPNDQVRRIPGPVGYYDKWRLEYNAEHTGNPYPTHGIGSIAQILGLHRGDKMNYLVSLSSAQKGITAYAKERFGEDSPEAKREYKLGDMNTTLVYTEKGRSMMLQHDVTSPRPYDRKHAVSGTKGYAAKYPVYTIAIEPNGHSPMKQEEMREFLTEWEHPIVKEVGEIARSMPASHGGMDFIMEYRLIYCLRNGLPLDMDVYDAAEWSCIVPLSELSVVNNSAPVEVPDFTRGAWNKVCGYSHAMAE